MKIDGRCHCGQIRFEAEVDPTTMGVCHCTDCQQLSGTAFRANIPASADTFVMHGIPKSYVKTAASGTKRRHAFCGECGTPIFATSIDMPKVYSLRIGTITQRAQFAPRKQIWKRSALPFVDTLASVPAVDCQ